MLDFLICNKIIDNLPKRLIRQNVTDKLAFEYPYCVFFAVNF